MPTPAAVGLRDFIDHYSESDIKLRSFDVSQLEPLLRPTLRPTVEQILATRDTLLNGWCSRRRWWTRSPSSCGR